MNKKTVLMAGPLITRSGYGVHSRQVARWILEREKSSNLDISMDCTIWGFTPFMLKRTGLVGEIMSRTGNFKQDYDLNFQLRLPNEFNNKVGSKFKCGISAIVETDKCNPQWVECCNKMDLVIVPSMFCKQTLLNSGNVKVPIEVIPESFPDEMLNPTDEKIDLKLTTPFNFLLFGQMTGNNPDNDRKNIFYTIKWFCEEFANDKDVGLVIKTNLGRNTKIDRLNVKNLLMKLLSEVKRSNFPKIYLLHGDMTDSEVASLYKHPSIKAMICFSKGEGFNLPALEAAACGLPVIATNWSAHTEFLENKFVPVSYNLRELHPSRVDNNIFMAGSKWAEPIETDAKSKLRLVKNNISLCQEKAKALQKNIVEKYNFNNVAQLYDNLLLKYLNL